MEQNDSLPIVIFSSGLANWLSRNKIYADVEDLLYTDLIRVKTVIKTLKSMGLNDDLISECVEHIHQIRKWKANRCKRRVYRNNSGYAKRNSERMHRRYHSLTREDKTRLIKQINDVKKKREQEQRDNSLHPLFD